MGNTYREAWLGLWGRAGQLRVRALYHRRSVQQTGGQVHSRQGDRYTADRGTCTQQTGGQLHSGQGDRCTADRGTGTQQAGGQVHCRQRDRYTTDRGTSTQQTGGHCTGIQQTGGQASIKWLRAVSARNNWRGCPVLCTKVVFTPAGMILKRMSGLTGRGPAWRGRGWPTGSVWWRRVSTGAGYTQLAAHQRLNNKHNRVVFFYKHCLQFCLKLNLLKAEKKQFEESFFRFYFFQPGQDCDESCRKLII